MRHFRKSLSTIVGILSLSFAATTAQAQYGATFSGVGPVNRSMGGTATAAPIDAMGALYWNPATISGLPGSSMEFGLELLYPQLGLSSSPAGPAPFERSDGGVFPLPSFGFVLQPQESMFSYGLGVFAAGGFGTNYPGNTFISTPPPAGIGLGPIYSQYQVLQIIPTISCQVTDRLSLGLSPILDLAYLSVDPAIFAPPSITGYPSGTHTLFNWGMGFQVGAYYKTDSDWNFGASLKSPQWFENFRYHAAGPSTLKFGLDVPMMVSLGTSYTGFERLTLALDAKYLDYSNTKGFSQSGFGPTGAVQGLGWNNVYAMSAGAQYLLSDAITLRCGYSFNTNPIPASQTFFNVASPLLIQHTVYMGASYNLTACLQFSVSYLHAFQNGSTGPIVLPGIGPLPGTSVTSTTAADALTAGIAVRF
jgi:long-chain fatty acid transport protein